MDAQELNNIRERHLKVAGMICKRFPDDADYVQVLYADVGALLQHIQDAPQLPRAA